MEEDGNLWPVCFRAVSTIEKKNEESYGQVGNLVGISLMMYVLCVVP
jgi:hypothetical protein